MPSDGHRARHKYHSNLYNAHPRVRSSHIYLEIAAACVPVGVRSAREINSTRSKSIREIRSRVSPSREQGVLHAHAHTHVHMHVRGDPRVHDRMHDIRSSTHLTRPSDPNKPRLLMIEVVSVSPRGPVGPHVRGPR